MKIQIQFGDSEKEIVLGSRFGRYAKWIGFILLLWVGTTLATIYLVLQLDPLSLVDLEIHLAKELNVKIDETIPVKAKIDEVLSLPVDKIVPVEVMVNQVFSVPVEETISVPLDLTVEVSLDRDFHVNGEVPINFTLPMNDTLYIELPVLGERPVYVRGEIPVNIVVPVSQTIHVKDVVPVQFKKTITIPFNREVRVPVKATVNSNVRLNTVFSLPVDTEIAADVTVKDTVRGMVDQTLVVDKDQVRIMADKQKTEQLKQDFYFRLPAVIRDGLEEDSPEMERDKQGKEPVVDQ